MKTIKVFIASSEELHNERLEIVDVIQNLNRALKPSGIMIAFCREKSRLLEIA